MDLEKKKKDIYTQQRVKRYVILMSITLAFVVLYSLTIPNFLSIDTVTNLIRQSTVLTILACGMTFVILTGGIDLSPGAFIALAGALAAIAINETGSALVGFAVCLAAGIILGLINGLLIGYMKIYPFIVTLATMFLARGLTLHITGGTRIVVSNEIFNAFGSYNFKLGSIRVPLMIIPLVLMIILSYLLLNKSVFGRKVYIIGGNPRAARASGINVPWNTMLVYVYMGAMVGVATIITIGRSASAQPLAATGSEFDVITAVVIGGITLAGGAGTLAGTLFGCLLMGIMLMGVNMINIPIYYNYIIKGVFILFAVLTDEISTTLATLKQIRTEAKKIDKQAVKKDAVDEVEFLGDFSTISFKNINKYFPGVQALDNVSFDIQSGTVHALVGENGAGKSTLMKILLGVYQIDSGEILIDGKRLMIKSPQDSQRKGISIIYQELALIPELTAAQNIFLGKEKRSKLGITIDINQMLFRAKQIIHRLGINIDPANKVKELTVGKQQMIEIARAIDARARIVVMDEPTSALSESDKEILFDLIKELKRQGITVIYISHRIQELFEIADQVTVLRDGKHVVTLPMAEVDENSLVKYMVNREIKDVFYRDRNRIGKKILEVNGLSREGAFYDISFCVSAGEVVGMAGLIGAGRTEVARCLFGLDKPTGGEIVLDGQRVAIPDPQAAIQKGICYVSEDRRGEGIIPLLSVRDNITAASLRKVSKVGRIIKLAEVKIAREYIDKFGIKTPADTHPIGNLSGGNQQKCYLARVFACNPRLIIFDEPTRGVDIGAKAEIHKLIESLSSTGIGIIIISSELPEILGSSDKIIVMAQGRMTAALDNNKGTTQEEIMAYATRLSS